MHFKHIIKTIVLTTIATTVMSSAVIACTGTAGAVESIKDSIPNLKAEKCFVIETTGFAPDEKVIINPTGDLFTCTIEDRVHEGREVYVLFDTKGTEKRNDDEVKSVVKPELPINWIENMDTRKIYERATTIGYEDGRTVLLTHDGNIFKYESPYYGMDKDVYLEFDYGSKPYDATDDKVLKMYDFWEILEMHQVDDLEGFDGGLYARV